MLETVLVIDEEKSNVKGLLKLEDEDGNSALHLSSQNEKFNVTKAILDFMGKEDATKAVMKENKFGWTPFSLAEFWRLRQLEVDVQVHKGQINI